MSSDVSPSFFALLFFFFNDTATTEIYTLSLHDALPISNASNIVSLDEKFVKKALTIVETRMSDRSEEHTSELQSHLTLVCRLLPEKKKEAGNAGSSQGRASKYEYCSSRRVRS